MVGSLRFDMMCSLVQFEGKVVVFHSGQVSVVFVVVSHDPVPFVVVDLVLRV